MKKEVVRSLPLCRMNRKLAVGKPPPNNRAQTDDDLFAPCFGSRANMKTRQRKSTSFHVCCRILFLLSRKFPVFQDICLKISRLARFTTAFLIRCRDPPLLKFWFSPNFKRMEVCVMTRRRTNVLNGKEMAETMRCKPFSGQFQ